MAIHSELSCPNRKALRDPWCGPRRKWPQSGRGIFWRRLARVKKSGEDICLLIFHFRLVDHLPDVFWQGL